MFLFASLLFLGCKKTADVIKKELPENISKQELLLWINNYQKLMPSGPKPILEKTLKTYFKGQMILKMPLSSGGGNLYFTKTDHLEVQFIRIVSADNQINTPFNGYYEFIDMKTYSYNKLIFKNGIKTNSMSNIILKYQEIIQSNSLIKSNSWLGDLLNCISRYIIAVPRSAELGGGCWVFSPGGSIGNPILNPGQVEVPPIGDSGGSEIGGIDWFNWFLYLNYPHSSPSSPDGIVNVGHWSPFPSGGGGESYPSNPPEGNPPYTDNPNFQDLTVDILDNMFGNPEGQDGEFIDDPNLIEYETPVSQRPLPKLSNWLIYFPKINNTQKMEAGQVYELVGGSLKNSYDLERRKYENACAVRGSRGLNYADPSMPIPILRYGNPPLQITQKGADQKNYILNSVAFEKYMIDAYGDTPIRLEGSAANNFGEVFKLLKGKSGIYVIINNDASERTGAGYSGHVDAIIDGKCVDKSFVNPRGGVKSIRIWVLKD